MQSPKHVTGRQSHHNQLFRVVLGRVTAECGVRRSGNGRIFSRREVFMLAAVTGISLRSLSAIPGPTHLDRIMVLVVGSHGSNYRTGTQPLMSRAQHPTLN